MADDAMQQWAKRLDALVAKADKLPRMGGAGGGGYTTPRFKHEEFGEWSSQSHAALVDLLGSDHVYVERFAEAARSGVLTEGLQAVGIMRAVREDLQNGHLSSLAASITAGVFADFLSMAEHLLDEGMHVPAASLAGAVLEDELRRLCGEDLRSLESLNKCCLDQNRYSRVDWDQIHVYTTLRNAADHGRFDEVEPGQVRLMLQWVRDFTSRVMARHA